VFKLSITSDWSSCNCCNNDWWHWSNGCRCASRYVINFSVFEI